MFTLELVNHSVPLGNLSIGRISHAPYGPSSMGSTTIEQADLCGFTRWQLGGLPTPSDYGMSDEGVGGLGIHKKMKKKSETTHDLNSRQVQLLQFLHGDSDERTNLTMHMNINQVAKMTAIKDLKDLVQKGFLTREKQGRTVYYYGTKKIDQLF